MTKIDLITGILGSGKTTFIRRYARHLIDSGKRIAILENDFGAVNIDMLMLQDLKGENCQLEMISGGGDPDCHKRRFKTQLIALGMQRFDRIIVEPSGIFDMDEFFDTLHESPLDRWFEAGSVITIVEAGLVEVLTDQMEYLLASEVSCCGKLVVSKMTPNDSPDSVAERIIDRVNRSLENIKCDRRIARTDIIAKDWQQLTNNDFLTLQGCGFRASSYVKKFSGEDISSSVHYFMHVRLPEDQIDRIIRELLSGPEYGSIYRIKGALPADNGGWIRLNATNEQLELDRIPEGQAVLIVIGDGIDRQAIDRRLSADNSDPEYVSI